jgi:hypothetical protein
MKRKTTKRRRKTGLSEHRKTTRRRSKSHSFLSDLTNPTIAKNSAKNTISSALGGLGAVLVTKNILPVTWGKAGKLSTGLIGGFLLQNFGLSNIGSSFTGGMFALAFQGGLLSDDGLNDDTTFADDMVLSNSPLYLDAEGTPMVLEEDGETFRPMTEGEAQQMGY